MTQGETVDLSAITEAGRTSGVPHGDALVSFAEAVVSRDRDRIARSRDALIAAMGVGAMVDAAAVAANFERMVRIADGTGIPLGRGLESRSRAVVDELQLERLKTRGG